MERYNDGLLKKILPICQSGWREIRTKFASGILLSPLGNHNKVLSAASQTLLAGERLRQCDADYMNYPWGKNESSDNFLFYINWMFSN